MVRTNPPSGIAVETGKEAIIEVLDNQPTRLRNNANSHHGSIDRFKGALILIRGPFITK